MRDMTITRASRRGAYTLPVEHGRPRTPKPGYEPISTDEMAWMIQSARQQRETEETTYRRAA